MGLAPNLGLLAPNLGLFELDAPSLKLGLPVGLELKMGLGLALGLGANLGLAVPLGPGDDDACCSSIASKSLHHAAGQLDLLRAIRHNRVLKSSHNTWNKNKNH